MASVVELIWAKSEVEDLCRHDWTGQISLIRQGKFGFRRGAMTRLAVPSSNPPFWATDPLVWPQGYRDLLTLARLGPVWLNGLMWARCRVCDSCQITPATVETESGFFLCEECEAVVVIAFGEFELADASSIGD